MTPTVDGITVPTTFEIMLSVVNDFVEIAVEEADPSISSGVGCSNVGLLGSK